MSILHSLARGAGGEKEDAPERPGMRLLLTMPVTTDARTSGCPPERMPAPADARGWRMTTYMLYTRE